MGRNLGGGGGRRVHVDGNARRGGEEREGEGRQGGNVTLRNVGACLNCCEGKEGRIEFPPLQTRRSGYRLLEPFCDGEKG